MNSRRLIAVCALFLFAAAGVRASPGAVHLAVLEFEVTDLKIDRTYFSDLARGAVHRGVPQVFVMTRESTEALLGANGKTMGDCIGECEVEVGRKLGADYIISGRITQVGSRLSLTMRLFSTADGQLMESAEARGRSADELLDHVDAAMESLVAPLSKSLAATPPASPAASKSDAPIAVTNAPAAKLVQTTPAPVSNPPPLESKPLASTAPASAPGSPPNSTPVAPTIMSTNSTAGETRLLVQGSPAPLPQKDAPAFSTAPTSAAAKITPANPTISTTPPASIISPATTVSTNYTNSTLSTAAPLPPAPSESLQENAPSVSSDHKKWGWLAIGTGALIAGGSAVFDNVSSTSKDGKLTAVDFLPVAGYAIALALGSYGIYQVARP